MRAPARLLGTLVTLGLLLPLAGCGEEHSIEGYCAALKQDQKQIAEMIESPSATSLLSHRPLLRDLAEKAPEDLTDEWQVFLGALDGLREALDDAGLEPSDFADGRPPRDASAADRKAVAAAASRITAPEVTAAATGIDQQARDVCKLNLGLA